MTVNLKDYQPFPFQLHQVELDFQLDDTQTIVDAVMSFSRVVMDAATPLHLFGESLELLALELNKQPLTLKDYHLSEETLTIHSVPDHFELHVRTRIFPQKNTQLSGLYRSQTLFCTQCEAEGFRRIMFFPDRPDVLTTFTTRISADKKKYPVLLSNGNLQKTVELPEGRHCVEWHDPFKKPAYLFALVAGDLACVRDTYVTASGKSVDLRVYVEHGQEDKCDHALQSLKHAMHWDEEVYGREYDLATYMIVAVSDFNMGAMENKGLNIFNAKYILASPLTATDNDYVNVEDVVGHEYFHNWTGNRVTCRDWFQLSLKEGLTVFREQSFSASRFAKAVKRIEDVKLMRAVQFAEDAGPMAHPVRPQSYEEINNFYTATIYNKGAEVIRMQHTILGEAGFRRGMDQYFETYDGQAVTIDDFVGAMASANQVDLSQFKRWYSQAGTPVVHVEQRIDNHQLSLVMTQSCPPTPESQIKAPFYIPIRLAAFTKQGKPIPTQTELLILKDATQVFELKDIPTDAVLSLLRDFSAPIQLDFKQSTEDYLVLLQAETDGFAKWEAGQRLALAEIHALMQQPQHWQLSEALQSAYRSILENNETDYALRALLLTPPSFEEVAMGYEVVDVDVITAARDRYVSALAHALATPAQAMIEALWAQEDNQIEPLAFGRRKLRHACLALLCRAGLPQAWRTCEQQFASAQNMTDESFTFGLLVNHPEAGLRASVIHQFYEKWAHDDLVLDKWFTAQALTWRHDALEQVIALQKHPKFSLTNPNKVRALIGAFCQANAPHFHALDGRGYDLLQEVILTLDTVNPQVAARLLTPFTKMKRYDAKRQALIMSRLITIERQAASKDVREIVTKTLGHSAS